MGNDIKKLLFDIKEAIIAIDTYIGEPKRFDHYESNAMLQDAVERNLEIIGEAVGRLLKEKPEIKITDARRIVDARNVIIHSYDNLDNAQIWAIVINHLPTLKKEVVELLDES